MSKITFLTVVTIFILLISNSIQAQLAVLHKGYIIKNSGEKISCLIREDSYNNYCEKIQYRLAGEKKLRVGTPRSIVAFEIPELTVKFETFEVMTQVQDRNSNLFPIKAKGFLKHLKEGKIDLYELYNPAIHSSIYYVKKEGLPLQRLEILRVETASGQDQQVDTLFRSKSIRDQLGQYKFKKNYLPTLSTLTADCPEVSIDQTTLLERRIVKSIIQTYNKCHSEQAPIPAP